MIYTTWMKPFPVDKMTSRGYCFDMICYISGFKSNFSASFSWFKIVTVLEYRCLLSYFEICECFLNLKKKNSIQCLANLENGNWRKAKIIVGTQLQKPFLCFISTVLSFLLSFLPYLYISWRAIICGLELFPLLWADFHDALFWNTKERPILTLYSEKTEHRCQGQMRYWGESFCLLPNCLLEEGKTCSLNVE